MRRSRGFSLIEVMIVLGVVSVITSAAVVAFTYAIHSARMAVVRDQDQLDAYNVATSLRAAMRYDRGAVAAIGAAPPSAWTLGSEMFTASPVSGNLTVGVANGNAAANASLVIPIVQEAPAPQSTVFVP